jgi:hypothetical protein
MQNQAVRMQLASEATSGGLPDRRPVTASRPFARTAGHGLRLGPHLRGARIADRTQQLCCPHPTLPGVGVVAPFQLGRRDVVQDVGLAAAS